MKNNVIKYLFPLLLSGICLVPLHAQDYLFRLEVNGAGTVIVNQSEVITPGIVYETVITPGTELSLRTIPDNCGAYFFRWEGGLTGNEENRVLTMPSRDITTTALFSGCSVGSLWLEPRQTDIEKMTLFTTELRLTLADENMAAYGLDLRYDPSILEIRNIEEGTDGFYSVGAGVFNPGQQILASYRESGTGPGENLHILTLTWLAIAEGSGEITFTIDTLNNSAFEPIAVESHFCQVNVLPQTRFKGDVNDDGMVTITDALLVAQSYVSTPPFLTDLFTGDVNCSGKIDIVDALLIAQNYVKLIGEFLCHIDPPRKNAYDIRQIEAYNELSGLEYEVQPDGLGYFTSIENGDWVKYYSVNFLNRYSDPCPGELGVRFIARSNTGGIIEIWGGGQMDTYIGSCTIEPAAGWTLFTADDLLQVYDRNTITFRFVGGDGNLMEIDYFYFENCP